MAICRSFFKIFRDSALEEFSLVFTPFLGTPGLVLLLVEDEQVDDEKIGLDSLGGGTSGGRLCGRFAIVQLCDLQDFIKYLAIVSSTIHTTRHESHI